MIGCRLPAVGCGGAIIGAVVGAGQELKVLARRRKAIAAGDDPTLALVDSELRAYTEEEALRLARWVRRRFGEVIWRIVIITSLLLPGCLLLVSKGIGIVLGRPVGMGAMFEYVGAGVTICAMAWVYRSPTGRRCVQDLEALELVRWPSARSLLLDCRPVLLVSASLELVPGLAKMIEEELSAGVAPPLGSRARIAWLRHIKGHIKAVKAGRDVGELREAQLHAETRLETKLVAGLAHRDLGNAAHAKIVLAAREAAKAIGERRSSTAADTR